jgi:hypothetical protein
MIPPRREKTEFERVGVYGDFVPGVIEVIEYDPTHKTTYLGEQSEKFCVRIGFRLDGYNFLHRSRWLTFSYGEKANLYKKFISKLVKNAKPDMCFDLDVLKGLRVKTIWVENGEYENLENVFPEGEKIEVTEVEPEDLELNFDK